MRKKGRRHRKESAINKMQMFFNTKDNADTYVRKIPLKNGTRSLNISIAVAITLSEALKQNFFFQND